MWKSILKAGLIAGTLDIIAASVQAYLVAGITPGKLLQFVASGAFGKTAFDGGVQMMAWGLIFHYIIAISCAACFFLFYRAFTPLKKLHWFVNAIFIGVIAWAITNLLVIPISQIGPRHFTFVNTTVAILILIVCIGIPISITAKKYFKT